MNKKIVLVLVLWLSGVQSAWAAPAVVWKTGQTDCRDEGGFVIACAGTGQDADNMPGAAWPSPRFADNGDGTVTDNLSGLIWLKNANCTDTVGGVVKTSGSLHWDSALTWSNNLASGECGLSDGSASGDWRLPNKGELYSLIDFAFYSPAVSNTTGTGQWAPGDPFTNVQSDRYWSSTTYLPDTTSAWSVFLDVGSVGYGLKTAANYYVWPVRGGDLYGNSGISASPSSRDFGTVASGSSSSAQTFTIENTGTNNLYLGTITSTGTDTGQFPVLNDNCSGRTVAPAGSCTLQAVFSPTSVGTKSASLSIPSNAAGSPTAVDLTGTGATVPGAPIIGTATAGNAHATISFTPPASDGGSAITGYTATSSPGSKTGTCAGSPCTVTGLTNGTAYTFTVMATNGVGTGAASAASNSVTPAPITITVTAGNDGAATAGNCPGASCLLRDAIAAATSGDTITFDSSVTGTITLTNGELAIDKDLSITGPGASSLTISGSNASRVFSVGPGVNATLSGVTVANGHAPDGADNGIAPGSGGSGDNGGGIYNDGTLTVTNVTFSGNAAGDGGNGSGEPTNNGGDGGTGGGIYNVGTLTVSNVVFSGNAAGTGGDGIGGDGSTINSGGIGGSGGGIYNVGILTVMNVTFSGNAAGSGGNGSGGITGDGGNGGDGGGICNNGTLTVTNVTFGGNATGSGGPGESGGIEGNGGNGGGLYSFNSATVTNSTFYGNSATGSGGGVYIGGIMNLNNTIVAGSTSGGDCGNSGSATVNAQNSLIEEGLSCVNGTDSNNLTGDPMLDALADNGGPTETMALQTGSPAIDAGDNSFLDEATADVDFNGDGDTLDAIAYDQRGDGYARVINGTVDMGAYEFSEAPSITSADNATVIVGSSGSFTVTTTGIPTPALSETGSLPDGVTFSDNGDGTAALSGTPASGTAGTYNITLTATNGISPNAIQSFTLTVAKADQTITFATLADRTFGDPDFTLAATASSGLTVSFASTTPLVCTVNGVTVTLTGAGSCSITASEPGDASYNAATDVIRGFTVNKADQTIAGLAADPSTGTLGGSASLSVSGSGGSGNPVIYGSTTIAICTVSAATVDFIDIGLCTVTANQAGNGNYNAALQVMLDVTINAAVPSATTEAATSLGETTATLNGIVAPNGSATTAWFEWGTSTGYGYRFPELVGDSYDVGSSGSTAIMGQLTGLSVDTEYHFRIAAENSVGASYGDDRTFTTGMSGSSCGAHWPLMIEWGSEYEFFATLLANVLDGDAILLNSKTLVENVDIDLPGLSILLEGGWACDFGSRTGTMSAIQGSLNITDGTVEMNGLTIK